MSLRRKQYIQMNQLNNYQKHIHRLTEIMSNQNRFMKTYKRETNHLKSISNMINKIHLTSLNFKKSQEENSKEKSAIVTAHKKLPDAPNKVPFLNLKQSYTHNMQQNMINTVQHTNKLNSSTQILHKLRNVHSDYKIRMNKEKQNSIKEKKLPNVCLEQIYKESPFLELNFPQNSYIKKLKISKKKPYFDLYLRFNQLAKVIHSDKYYSLTIKCSSDRFIKTNIYHYNILLRDTFNIIVSEKDLVQQAIMIEFDRVNENDEYYVGQFLVKIQKNFKARNSSILYSNNDKALGKIIYSLKVNKVDKKQYVSPNLSELQSCKEPQSKYDG